MKIIINAHSPPDLIETLWNVKMMIFQISSQCIQGFNRNIVECKVMPEMVSRCLMMDLIETLWNVKLEVLIPFIKSGIGFNRNIVECKACTNSGKGF